MSFDQFLSSLQFKIKGINKAMGICQTAPKKESIEREATQNKQLEPQDSTWLKQFDIEKPHLLCPNENVIAKMCISRHCRNISLFCQKSDCKACMKVHPECGSVKLDHITQQVQKRAELQRQLVLKIQEIEIKTFQSIQNKRAELIQNFFMDGFSQRYADLVEGIFLGTKTIHLNGQIAEQFYWRLKQSNSKLARAQSQTIKYFKRQMERISVPLMNLEQQVMKQYLKRSQVMTLNQEKTLSVSQIQSRENNFGSSIIDKKNVDQIRFIQQSLDYPKNMKLMFTASDYQFKAEKFHEICDNVPHTFVLVLTEFDKIIGGYTPIAWNATRGYAQDEQGIGFLLSVTHSEKMSLTRPQKAVQCIPDHGPVFGSGADLAIVDECNLQVESCVNFPFCYNNNNKYKYNQDAWTMLCGNPNGKKFRVKEYEVFEVIW